MRKQLLLFVASLSTAAGAALLMLTLVLTLTSVVYANTETTTVGCFRALGGCADACPVGQSCSTMTPCACS